VFSVPEENEEENSPGIWKESISLWLYAERCITVTLFLCSCTWQSLNFPVMSVLANMLNYC